MTASGFFASRWRGEVPLGRLFWWDMIVVGTIVNAATSIAALLAFSLDAPTAAGLAIFLSPLPYNLFLVAAVWRTAADSARETGARAGAVLWLIAATLI